MEQDIDGIMTEDEARAAGYLPTAEVPDLIGVQRNVRELGKTMRREGLRPVRVGHAYWMNPLPPVIMMCAQVGVPHSLHLPVSLALLHLLYVLYRLSVVAGLISAQAECVADDGQESNESERPEYGA